MATTAAWATLPEFNGYLLARRTDLLAGENVLHSLDADLETWLSDPLMQSQITELYRNLCSVGDYPSQCRSTAEWRQHIRGMLEQGMRCGEIVLLQAPRSGALHSGMEAENVEPALQPAAPVAVLPRRKTWIEIELVDSDGNPVANERCRLELPDGTIWEGATNSAGIVRVDFIDHGQCEVNFPDIDLNEWRAA